jgi:hypothetical protein
MERYCSTGQSPQRAVAPTEEEEEIVVSSVIIICFCLLLFNYLTYFLNIFFMFNFARGFVWV